MERDWTEYTQRYSAKRRAERGEKRVAVWVPVERVDELKAFAAKLRAGVSEPPPPPTPSVPKLPAVRPRPKGQTGATWGDRDPLQAVAMFINDFSAAFQHLRGASPRVKVRELREELMGYSREQFDIGVNAALGIEPFRLETATGRRARQLTPQDRRDGVVGRDGKLYVFVRWLK